jgi:hypothetical protein
MRLSPKSNSKHSTPGWENNIGKTHKTPAGKNAHQKGYARGDAVHACAAAADTSGEQEAHQTTVLENFFQPHSKQFHHIPDEGSCDSRKYDREAQTKTAATLFGNPAVSRANPSQRKCKVSLKYLGRQRSAKPKHVFVATQ